MFSEATFQTYLAQEVIRSRPNIVYFVCHDLGRHLPVYGVPTEAPNLSQLAEEGVVFTRAFCNSPACSPSRACAMTGQFAHHSGAIGLAHMGWALRPEVRTVVDYLNDAGYQTALCGMNHERAAGTYRYEVDETATRNHRQADQAVNDAIDFMKNRRDPARPFYLNIGTTEVHTVSLQTYIDRYGGPVPDEEVALPIPAADTPELRRAFGCIQSAIRFLDTHVGRLLAAIDETGLRDSTLFVFTTDHGLPHNRGKGTLYDAGVGISLIMRPPSAIVPDAPSGVRYSQLIGNIDLAPTILEAAGIPTPSAVDGRSFWGLLTGAGYEPNGVLFLERNYHGEWPDNRATTLPAVDLYDPIRSIRTPEWTLIRNYLTDDRFVRRRWLPWEITGSPEWGEVPAVHTLVPIMTERRPAVELFHTVEDPNELIDLAGRPEWRAVRADLEARLQVWMDQTDDFAGRRDPPPRPYKRW